MNLPHQLTRLRRGLRATLLSAAGLLLLVSVAQGQNLPTLKDDFRNVLRVPGATGKPWPPTPAVSDPLVATPGQYQTGSAFGTRSIGSSVALTTVGTVGTPVYSQNPEGTIKLRSASFGRSVVLQTAQFQFGDIIPPPTTNDAGVSITLLNKPKNVLIQDPAFPSDPTKTITNTAFYYSPDADTVYASFPGTVTIIWETATLPRTELPRTYIVSSSPARDTRSMYWTEQGFKAPRVAIPAGRVDAIRFAYNPRFPQKVTTPYVSPFVPPPGDPNFQAITENRTLWFDNADQQLHAYNYEGRVLVEYLGPPRDATGLRTHLGIELVEVTREIAPVLIRVDIGEALPPLPNLAVGAEDLTASFISGLNLDANPFVFEHLSLGGTKATYYGIRTTTPTLVAGGAEVLSNEVLTFWMEAGLRGIRWPKYYAGYIISWPVDDTRFSLYVRPDKATEDSTLTAVQLNSSNNPTLVFQDDPTKQEAQVNAQNQFYTSLSGTEQNRSLIQYTNGDDIWFERVKSIPTTTSPGYAASIAVNVGARITPPAAALAVPFDDGDGDPSDDVFVGYIHQKSNAAGADGRDYNPLAYINPFQVGFDEAKKGAIIGVNARPGKDSLEVWWYRRSNPPGTKLTGTYWPSFVQKYTLQWPATGDEIVLASNIGSNDIGLAGNGTIYTQNNSTLPGYNPNEEHALMSQGRAWALRDDLNLKDNVGRYTSSAPFVLVDYTEADQRPAMRIFRVRRESEVYRFSYPAIAGTPLGRPKPLDELPTPLGPDNKTLNVEVAATTPDLPVNFVDADPFKLYRRYTFIDRKQAHWVYRGKHDGSVGEFRMRYRYPIQPGFYFPDKGASQPAVGAIACYIRPLDGNGVPVGDSVTGTPLDVVFLPQWPASAPVLNVGETLTLARAGLPQVRGQSSAEVVYQQSIAASFPSSLKKSIRLYDPTIQKRFDLVNPTTKAVRLKGIPTSVNASDYLGRKYFPNLPPHLSQRLYYDPNLGASTTSADGTQVKGSLVLKGEFVNEVFGEDYLLPNILSAKDLSDAQALCLGTDTNKAQWDAAINGLTAQLDTYVERTEQPGTYKVGSSQSFGPLDLAEVTLSSTSAQSTDPNRPVGTAVDSYAVAATDGGEGFVVLAMGNGNGKIQSVGEPVSLQVFRVARPLGAGELKVLTSANPLDEKVTIQHSLDFAGKPENYEFQFLRSSPGSDGGAPDIYPDPARELVVGDGVWRLIRNPPAAFAQYRTAAYDDLAVGTPFTSTTLPANQITINNDPTTYSTIDLAKPNSILRRAWPVSANDQILRLYLSLDLSDLAGAIVYLNNAEVAVINVPGRTNTPTESAPGGDFDPLSYIFSLPVSTLQPGTNNVLTVQLYSTASGPQSVNLRLEAATSSYDPATLPTGWFVLDPVPGEVEASPASASGKAYVGKVRHVIEGSSPQTLSDNYFTMRYREKGTGDGAWSRWTDAKLVEGWIKRVLNGINPFNQRVTDLLNNPVNTDVSLLTQAGGRWEGDIALTLGNINSVGLIEIYETVLRRGQALSINGTPRINDPAVNSALLLAAGYLSDLYTLVGNEAFADAANPTIATGTDGASDNIATSLFAFKGQLSSVLEEELALLRGRDDSLAPGSNTKPIYNRLVWNYTRGILSGEAIYAVNYNIRDVNFDGKVDAADAAILYPQGHGDAYGHYLTALTGYYQLLNNDFFSWAPRSESVLVLGQEVSVDYFDERKMAAAAANVARAGAQILDLTYRQAFTSSESAGWTHLRDLRAGQPVVNPSTLVTRSWGVDDWACRTGQGAYLNWIAANSGLADVDPNVAHEGIQKIDRGTVPELAEIVAQGESIQQTLDNADARLNPLGLSRGVLSFDISPTEVDAGKTHFEQIYKRAIAALQNTTDAFDNARSSTQFLRAQEESLSGLQASIAEQERAFENQLIDLYGTPYPEDIGPGKTYAQDYAGPDLVHALYAELPEIFNTLQTRTFELPINPRLDTANAFVKDTVSLVVDTNGLPIKPVSFVGRREHPGRAQSDVSSYLVARQQLQEGAKRYLAATDDLNETIALMQGLVSDHDVAEGGRESFRSYKVDLTLTIKALEALSAASATAGDSLLQVADAAAEALPKAVGLATDATSIARGLAKLSAAIGNKGFRIIAVGLKGAAGVTQAAIDKREVELNASLRDLAWQAEHRQLLYGVRAKLRDLIERQEAIDASLRALDESSRGLQATFAEGIRVQREREIFRQRSAAIVQGYRTRDLAFRAFRNEALEKYKTLFDLSARYTFLAARAYDFETGLIDASGNAKAGTFFNQIVQARAPGVLIDGRPQFGGSTTGDPGLAGVLAQLDGDWSVVKTRLGFNNPDRYRTTFSLRGELLRILPGTEGDAAWKEALNVRRTNNILDDADVRRYCLQAGDPAGLAVPGIIIEFPSTIANGFNFFGQPLAGGDHGFSATSFATKIRAAGIAFPGYVGMDSPTSTTAVLGTIGATSPSSPSTSFSDTNALSATPYIYLVPAGTDSLRAPPLGSSSAVRSWQVDDQAIPLPFDIGGTDFASRHSFVAADSLSEPAFSIRRHQAFRAVPGDTVFRSDAGFTNARLIGRSVWNSRWKLVIPGPTLLNDPDKGLETFSKTVKDIQLHIESYSYSGN